MSAERRIQQINEILAGRPDGLQIGGPIGKPGDIPATLKWIGPYPFRFFGEKRTRRPHTQSPSERQKRSAEPINQNPKIAMGEVVDPTDSVSVAAIKELLGLTLIVETKIRGHIPTTSVITDESTQVTLLRSMLAKELRKESRARRF